MRIALVGNMNNNFFSLLRYLRDLGIDAYLLLYKNELDHFAPENDTWEIEKWKPYIKKIDVVNGGLKSLFSYSSEFLKNEFSGYDYYIANGFAPALFYKAGLQIDLFLPYSVNIEYTYFYNKRKLLDEFIGAAFRFFQVRGLKKTVKLLGTIDDSVFRKALKYKLKAIPLAMPMVYPEAITDVQDNLKKIIDSFSKYSLVIFSHVSHMPYGSQGYELKRNDIIIKSFAQYKQLTHDSEAVLVLLDYGKGVKDSKELIASLDITDAVIWLPKMCRKELMVIIQHIDIGVGELGGLMWGGTVWEFMASGKPFFQYVNLSDEKIAKLLNAPCPNFLNTENEIVKVLTDFRSNPKKYANMGVDLKQWFDLYGGIGLAKVYSNILCNIQ